MGELGTKQVYITWAQGDVSLSLIRQSAIGGDRPRIFAGETYKPIPLLRDVRLIVDIGANIGAASLCLHTQYPDARLEIRPPAI